jgi:hypothetical protein
VGPGGSVRFDYQLIVPDGVTVISFVAHDDAQLVCARAFDRHVGAVAEAVQQYVVEGVGADADGVRAVELVCDAPLFVEGDGGHVEDGFLEVVRLVFEGDVLRVDVKKRADERTCARIVEEEGAQLHAHVRAADGRGERGVELAVAARGARRHGLAIGLAEEAAARTHVQVGAAHAHFDLMKLFALESRFGGAIADQVIAALVAQHLSERLRQIVF